MATIPVTKPYLNETIANKKGIKKALAKNGISQTFESRTLAKALNSKYDEIKNDQIPEPKTRYQWKKAISVDRVSRRLHDGAPDFIVIRVDYLSNTETMKQSRMKTNALHLISYFIRYGFWNTDGKLAFNIDIKKRIGAELGLDLAEMDRKIRDCINLGFLKRHPDMYGKQLYSLNKDILFTANVEEIILKPKPNTGKA